MSSKVFFIGDLHLGHRHILSFSPSRGGSTPEEHDDWIVKQWNSVVGKRDVVYVLGDVAFSKEGLHRCNQLKGQKMLIMGNHDKFPIEEYQWYFRIKPGIIKYKGFWLSHCPIHPAELRGSRNIHGHVHRATVRNNHGQLVKGNSYDDRYINACVEQCNGKPILLDDIAGKLSRPGWYETTDRRRVN